MDYNLNTLMTKTIVSFSYSRIIVTFKGFKLFYKSHFKLFESCNLIRGEKANHNLLFSRRGIVKLFNINLI
jgi:hypothetical protein